MDITKGVEELKSGIGKRIEYSRKKTAVPSVSELENRKKEEQKAGKKKPPIEGITQDELAARMGVDRDLLKHWEIGDREIKASALFSVSKALGVSADYLLGFPEAKAQVDRMLDYTGLSEDACNVLHALAISDNDDAHEVLDFLSRLICVLSLSGIGDNLRLISAAYERRQDDNSNIEISSTGSVTLPPLVAVKHFIDELSSHLAVNAEVVCWDRLEGR